MATKTKKKPGRKQAKKTRTARTKGAPKALKAKKLKKKATAVKARKPARAAKSRTAKKARKTGARASRAKAPARKIAKAPTRKVVAKAPARKPAPVRKAPAKAVAVRPAAARHAAVKTPPARLQRERRRLPEAEEENFTEVSGDSRLMSSARAGHDELRSEMRKHTESSPAMTAGDVDAKWQDAYALGDEAPGGDNMTPDQDRVDDIGKALGIEYADDEELLGGDELTERDEHRWELDPASKEEDDDL